MPSLKTITRAVKQARKAVPNAIRTLRNVADDVDTAAALAKQASSAARDLAESLRALLPQSKELTTTQAPVRPAKK